ncbi:MAG: hypothetical protein L0Z46_08755 [Nitrospiraceae bacterium]|nr:hypothetical protein [Nitrospiraceae bacterium]
MPRLQALDPKHVTGTAKDLLDGIQAKLGFAPNLARTMANSPAVLEAYVGSSAALTKGVLGSRLRVQIALTVAEATCDAYCLAASTAFGKLAGLSEEAILDSRRGQSPDSREEATLHFARKLVARQGRVSDEDLTRLRRIGYGDGDIAEIVANVALNIFTSYFNHVAGTHVDFPGAPELPAPESTPRAIAPSD